MKYTNTSVSEELEAALTEKIGGFSNLPPNMEQITQNEHLAFIMTQEPTYSEFRQPFESGFTHYLDEDFKIGSMNLQFNGDGSGVAVVKNGRFDESEPYRFYKFHFCAHEYKTTKLGNCHTRYKCIKCGLDTTLDSSD